MNGIMLMESGMASNQTDAGALPALNGSALTGVSGGKILQFLNFVRQRFPPHQPVLSRGFTSNSGNYYPTKASGKILIRFSCSCYMEQLGRDSYRTTLYRGTVASGTHLGHGTEGLSRINESNSAIVTEHTFEVVDQPSTTNAVTYQVSFKSSTTNNPKRFVMNNTPCEMIIMEMKTNAT